MWHEARRQERKIRGMLVDYRRRAERRRDFYEKIKADPTQFLQLHGRPCKIHLDSAVAAAADSPATMMPWQGQADTLIDRFDVRAHLDFIPPIPNRDSEEESYEERQCNYERYRILAQNNFLGINEEKFLKQLHLEEQFGYTADNDKDKKRKGGAAIGFNYDDPGKEILKTEKTESDSDDSDSDLDVDLCIDVSKIEQSQAHEMNRCGQQFGMCSNDFYSFLINDMEEAENIRIAREEEHEKALYSGRKSRRERRAHRERRLANRIPSPPSYAARASPTYPAFRESKSNTKSPSPVNAGQITYITSFGGDEEPSTSTKPTYRDKVKYGKPKKDHKRNYRSHSRGRSLSRDRYRHKRSKSHSRSRSPKYRHRRSSSRSKSPHRHHRRSKSNDRYRRRRSRSNRRRYSRSRSRSHSRSRRYRSSSSSSLSSSSSSSLSKSRSRSITPTSESPVRPESPKPIQRYYGRRQEDKSSSELGDSSDDDKSTATTTAVSDKQGFGNTGTTCKGSSSTIKMTPQERLKRKMQILLNKQYKADKIAEQIRTERAQQEQRNREDELREMALKLRRKQRERRHAYDDNSRSSDSDSSNSSKQSDRKRSVSPSSSTSSRKRKDDDKYEEKRREREKSPKRPRIDREERDRHRYRDRESPSIDYDRKRDRRYEEKKRDDKKHKSLVDY